MAKKPFMLVSLNEKKAKKLSHVLSNKTAVKMLDYLAGKDATESQIAKALKIPLSTVHYNMQQLVEAKLVVCEEFHYSSRGKEVNHYALANKYIIIAPTEEDETFLQHLKKYLPAGVILAGATVIIQALRKFVPAEIVPAPMRAPAGVFEDTISSEGAEIASDAIAKVAEVAPEIADTAVEEVAPVLAKEAMGGGTSAASVQSAPAGVAESAMERIVENVTNVTEPVNIAEIATENVTNMTDSVVQVVEPIVQVVKLSWWQSPVVDWVLMGAFAMLVLMIGLRFFRDQWQP